MPCSYCSSASTARCKVCGIGRSASPQSVARYKIIEMPAGLPLSDLIHLLVRIDQRAPCRRDDSGIIHADDVDVRTVARRHHESMRAAVTCPPRPLGSSVLGRVVS